VTPALIAGLWAGTVSAIVPGVLAVAWRPVARFAFGGFKRLLQQELLDRFDRFLEG
jgi:hypothetical protein